MRFANYNYIYIAFMFFALLVVFYIFAFSKRKAVLRRFAKSHLLKKLIPNEIFSVEKRKAFFTLSAIFLILFSLLRPQWGFHWEEVKRKGLDIIIAIDVSKSMLAEDVKPNRLERSKLAVQDLIKKLKGDRIGLIAFAGSAFLQCPLTVDYNGFAISLDDLSVNTIPRGGTSIAKAIECAIKSFDNVANKYKVLVLITDGESHVGDTIRMAEKAKEEGIKIFCIGIGTPEGELIPVTDENGRKVFLKDRNGNVVKSRLDEKTLQKIAIITGGSYVRATGAQFGLDLIYEEKLSKMEKREIETKMSKQYEERYQWFLFAAFLFLLFDLFAGRVKVKAGKAAVVILFILFFPVLSYANPISDIFSGNKAFKNSDYDAAIEKYNSALIDSPDSCVANFNMGDAYYKKKEYDKAMEYYNKALLSDDPELEAKANFNIGNLKYRFGRIKENTNLEEAVALTREALEYYKRALEINPDDDKAKYNHEFVESYLKNLLDKLKNQSEQNRKNEKRCQNCQNGKSSDKQDQNKNGGAGKEDSKERNDRNKANGQNRDNKDMRGAAAGKEKDKEDNDKNEKTGTGAKKGGEDKNDKDKNGSSGGIRELNGEKDKDKKENGGKDNKKDESGGISENSEAMSEGDLTKEEAERLLDSYRQEEALQGKIKKRASGRDFPVLKDW